MKRRVVSLVTALILCLNLCPAWALAAGTETHEQTDAGYQRSDPASETDLETSAEGEPETGSETTDSTGELSGEGTSEDGDQPDDSPAPDDIMTASDPDFSESLDGDMSGKNEPHVVSSLQDLTLNGYSITRSAATAVQIQSTGALYLRGPGAVKSEKGAGIEIQSGGFLSIDGQSGEVTVTGTTYGLDIASGAAVSLTGGTFTGKTAAIRTADGDFGSLLESGYAYFDAAGNPLTLEDMASAKTVAIQACMDHTNRTYAHTEGETTHVWTCTVCETQGTEPCTFAFDGTGKGTCDLCGNGVTIAVDRESLKEFACDDTVKPVNGAVTVTLDDGAVLAQDTDYAVSYQTRADTGDTSVTVTVMVDGTAYEGTFTQEFTFTEDDLKAPVLEWANKEDVHVTYTGEPVEKSVLPVVSINIASDEDLAPYLQYSHRDWGQGETAYTDGLPTNVGTYEVVVTLPEEPVNVEGYQAASSEPIKLIVEKLDPLKTAPNAAQPVYNGSAQDLVTSGELFPAAVNDGAVILFAASETGEYSANIPTGVNAGDYHVWYKVEATGNCEAVGPVEVPSVLIQRKPVTPKVELEYYKVLYDNGWKEPKVTVTDEEDGTVLRDTEYKVTYVNNKNVGTATVQVTDQDGGNYAVSQVNVDFEITSKIQDTLSITGKPNTVIYGDEFTLSTVGGSGSGDVTWEVISGDAEVNTTGGQVKITGHGDITIKATKSGTDPDTGVQNYEDATAAWAFTADKRAVVAAVTAEDKFFDGKLDADVNAVVEQGVLAGDEVTITGLTGKFDTEDAGQNKLVTVNKDDAEITGTNHEHYEVSYSSLTVRASIHKAVVKITAPPHAANPTYNGSAQDLIDTAAAVDTSGVQVEYALSEGGPYSTNFPQETNAGVYTVWYRVEETPNYTGLDPAFINAPIQRKPVEPTIKLSGDGLITENDGAYSYIYDGNAKTPVVTLFDGTDIIPEGNYKVEYSGNINVGAATVTVTAEDEGNYEFDSVEETFAIQKEKAQVTSAPEAAGEPLTYNTFAQKLVTAGAGTGGTMVYTLDDPDDPDTEFLPAIPTGENAGKYKVYYKVAGDANHEDSDVGFVAVTIAPKTVKDPTIELLDGDDNPLVSYTYDGGPKTPGVVVKDGSTVIEAGEYNIIYSDNTDAGKGIVDITDKPNGNYTVTGSATFVILKANIEFDPKPKAADITYDGQPHELLIPGSTTGGEVLYALNSPTSTYTAAIPTATAAGDYTVYYKVTGDKNHNDLTVQEVPVTIGRKQLTAITIELTPEGFEYDGSVKLPEVTVKDGKTVLPEEEYTWDCDVASPVNKGTYTITIRDAEKGNYDLTGVTDNTATFIIGQTAQEMLVIESKPASTVYGDTFTLTTSGGSGTGTVTWSAEGPATVNLATGEVEITDVGEVTITATNPGDQNYLPISAQWTFTAAKKPVTATVTVENKAYDGTTDAVVDTVTVRTLDGDTVSIDPASIKASFDTPDVGAAKTVTLDTSRVQVTGDAEKYDITYPETVQANITQAATVITAPEKIEGLKYNRGPQALVTAGESNVGFLVYSLDGVHFSPEIPTGTNADTYTVYYKVEGTANYTEAVGDSTITVIIAPKAITPDIKLSAASYVYDGSKKEPDIIVRDGQTVIEDDQYTVSWADDNDPDADDVLIRAGTYTATITSVPGGNYTFTGKAQVEITPASQAALSITGQPARVYYGDRITTLRTTGGSGEGTVTWSFTAGGTNSSIDTNTGELTVKDTGSITVKAERAVPNYGTVTDTWTFTVEPKPVTAVVTIAPKDYDGTNTIDDAAITAAVKTSDLVDPTNDSITISGLKGTYDDVNAGTNKTVTLDDSAVTVTGDTVKYAVTFPGTAAADITPRRVDVTVTLSGNDLREDDDGWFYIYDGTEKTPDVTVTADDDGAALTTGDYAVSYTGNKNAGTATVTVSCKTDGNYTFDDAEVHFTIKNSAAVLTDSPKAKDLTFTGAAQDLVTVGAATGGHIEYSLDNTVYSKNIPQETNAGTYIVYYMVKGDENHEDTAPSQVSVTIKPKEITPTITLGQDTYTYDGTEKKPTVTVTDGVDALITVDGVDEYTVSYQDNVNAGTAKVTVSNASGGNYMINGTKTFTIEKAESAFTTVPKKNDGLQYNGAAQELVTAGGSSHGTVVYALNGGNYSTTIPTGTAVDTYTVSYKILGDDNHDDSDPVDLTVKIEKNNVTDPTVTLSSNTFQYNGSQQKPVITVYDDNGLTVPEREYVVTITGTKGSNMVDVDTYTIEISAAANSNYIFPAGTTRTFEITAADQETISITGAQAQVRYGDVIQLGVTGGTGSGTVTWTVKDAGGNPAASTISATGLLTVKEVGGPVTVTVTRSAGGNYSDVSATWEFSASKRPVTAVLTGVDREYRASDKSATVKAAIPESELVFGDTFVIPDLTGVFDDENVGTDKKVTITGPKPEITDPLAANYDITYPATATASITKANVTGIVAPTAVDALTYDGTAQALLTSAGSVTGGILEYSLDNQNYSASIPTGVNAGDYTIWYRVKGDGNHKDTAGTPLTEKVTIAKQNVARPTIELDPSSATYDGNLHQPAVTVKDNNGRVIPESAYSVTYDAGTNWKDVGKHKVTIADSKAADSNYTMTGSYEEFEILPAGQLPLSITNQPSGMIHYGDVFTLSAVGGSGAGAIKWDLDAGTGIVTIDENGLVKVVDVGLVTVKATKEADANYSEISVTWTFHAEKKPITAIVTADDKVYNTNDNADIHISWKDGDLVGTDSIDTNLTGKFENANVGTNKTVHIEGTVVDDSTSRKYAITIPKTTTASITKATAAVPGVTARDDLEYTGSAQALVTGGDANTRYSTTRDGVYTSTVPTGTNAGTYDVWYKAAGDANYNESAPMGTTVTIKPQEITPTVTLSGNDLQTDVDGTYWYAYDGTEKTPAVTVTLNALELPGSEYAFTYSDNKNVGSGTVTVKSTGTGNYTFDDVTVHFTIKSAGAQLVKSPEAKDLTYTGDPQELVSVGQAAGGHIEYSLDDADYSQDIPKKTNAGVYTVYYKVVGDSNHQGPAPSGSVSVTIKPREIVNPTVTVTGSYTYDSTEQKPALGDIEVKDGTKVIPNTEYSVSYRNNINAGTAEVVISGVSGGNYIISGAGEFTIEKGTAAVAEDGAPGGREDLPYNGTAQELVTAGSAAVGTMVYSLSEDGPYSPAIPTASAVGSYTVWYKAQGDSNHEDSEPDKVPASIAVNTVTTPIIQVEPESVTYNGTRQEPAVTVRDDNGFLIDGSEYTVTFADGENTDLIKAGTYTVTIKNTENSNYVISDSSETFTITPADQTPLVITNTQTTVSYGDKIQLNTTGGNGTVTWSVDDDSIASISDSGLLTITGIGSAKVTATSRADGYTDQTATWSFYADQKQVTAVLTGVDREYSDGDTSATVTAAIPAGDLAFSDDVVTISGLTGTFGDPNVGTDKKVTVDSANASISGNNSKNYKITYPAATTASITKADIKAEDVTAPTAVAADALTYDGTAQALLVSAGSVTGGILEYSLDNQNYSASLPTGADAGTYDIWYRVKGDGNHNDTKAVKLTDGGQITIARQKVENPIIEFTPSGASYDGAVHKPAVTVKDNSARVIPESEYEIDYGTGDWIKAGDYEVTVTNKTGGNYEISEKPATFTILPMGQNPLSILGQPGTVRYGDTFTLSAIGGSGAGTVTWLSSQTGIVEIDPNNGLVTVKGVGGPVTITATKLGDGNYGASAATWTFRVEKKPITAIVTAENREWNGGTDAVIHVTWPAGALVSGDNIDTTALSGAFESASVGTNKTVNITGGPISSDNYDITVPLSTTASITKKAAEEVTLTGKTLTYSGSPQPLVDASAAAGKTVAYSQDGVSFSLKIPAETNAETYTVWYKVLGDDNHADSGVKTFTTTIGRKTVSSDSLVIELSSETFEYDGTPKKPDVVVKDGSTVIPSSEYTVRYSNNTAAGTATVTITDSGDGNYVVNGTKDFTIRAAVASLENPPKANSLTYNRFEQELVTPGTAKNGRVVYSTEKNGTYSTSIPVGTDADTYQVWYKVQGENGAEVSDPEARSITVTIQPKQVTPTILVNGQYGYTATYTGQPQKPPLTVSADGKMLTAGFDYIPNYSNNTNVGTATVTVQNANGSNYEFVAYATFEIVKAKAVFAQNPTGIIDLPYNGDPQKLAIPGITTQGSIFYSLDNVTYTPSIPTGTDVGEYVVFAKVIGNSTYEDSDVVWVTATIITNEIDADDLNVSLSANSFPYTGQPQTPTVEVTDSDGNIIDAREYSVTYSNNTDVGTASVTIKSKGSNYSFQKTVDFTISGADQPPLTITGKQDTVYYGDTLSLSTTGGSGGGAVSWSIGGAVKATGSGQFEITGAGSVTIKATKAASSGYDEVTDTWTFTARPKPINVTVTAADKPYDSKTTATLTVTVRNSDLVGTDSFNLTAEGHFADANVGTNKTVIIDSVNIPDDVKAKYDVSCPDTTTASITKAFAKVDTLPAARENLIYTGRPQALVTPGDATGGEIAYSLDGINYSLTIPTAVDAGQYTVWYKVLGDGNYSDSARFQVEGGVNIGVNTGAPTVQLSSTVFQYDGTEKTPTVTVFDSSGRQILEDEYTVTIGSPRIAVGNYTVTVTDKSDYGNYEFTEPVTAAFTIDTAVQNPLSIVTDIPTGVHYGDTFRLSATGGSGAGAIKWKSDTDVGDIDDNGVVTVKGTGSFTIEAYREADGSYSKSNTASLSFYAEPKPVTPVVTAANKPYDGGTTAALTAKINSSDLVGQDKIELIVGEGTFESADVGSNKNVTFAPGTPNGVYGNYEIKWPESTVASIYKVDARLDNAPVENPNLTAFNGSEQYLVTAGTTVDNIGTVKYSMSQYGAYLPNIPTAVTAGAYTVWYKVEDTVNYTGIPATAVGVTIGQAEPTISPKPIASGTVGQLLSQIPLTGGAAKLGDKEVPGTFTWADDSIDLSAGTAEYGVIFTPNDTINYKTITLSISVTAVSADDSYTDDDGDSTETTNTPAPIETSVENGTATTVVSASAGSELVKEAAANNSQNVVIKPEITDSVTKSEVSIPASTVSQLTSETSADLTVSTPMADVTIPSEALNTLSGASGDIQVVTEQVENAVALTLTAGGETVDSIPGGLTLTVPVEDAAPGTVAVLLHDDGTRETIRKAVPEDGTISIPLDGSATVEIVDNSRSFEDVSDTSWAADAVAFASAHELFNGTSDTTFSPDEPMSRAMLATVLYNLEGHPEQSLTSEFSDVSSDAWYAASVSWVTENGIVSGYGDGQFGPDDNVTREQLAVMLWRYMGSPLVEDQDLDFTDADQISDYALDALRWATAKGILNGYGDGQLDPGGLATRAQVAQMMKNFLENI